MSLALQEAVCAATLGLLGGGMAYASTWPTSQIFGPTLIAGSNPREIALTFDDGPNPAATPKLLEVLARHNVRATFFVIGDFVRRQPQLTREILAAGHTLGNHTMHHPRLSLQPASRVRQELADGTAAIEDTTGAPVKFFRPPFGARRPLVLQAAGELGLTPVMWNVTAYDWKPIGHDRILANLQVGIERNQDHRRGSNLLLHDGSHTALGAERMDTVRATDRLLTESSGSLTRFITVDAWVGPS